MILWCEHNHTILESCLIPSYQRWRKASLRRISPLFPFITLLLGCTTCCSSPWKEENTKWRTASPPTRHVWNLSLEGNELVLKEYWLSLVLLPDSPPPTDPTFIVHGHSLDLWMKFWWKTWRTHLNWEIIFCIFYSGFCHHNWSRHEILQWSAKSNSRRIHLCAPDTALYAGTGRRTHSEACFLHGSPWVSHLSLFASFFSFN